MKKSFYIGTRINPQFNRPYYVAFGQLTKKDAKAKSDCAYGSMFMESYSDVESYNNELERLKSEGFTVNVR